MAHQQQGHLAQVWPLLTPTHGQGLPVLSCTTVTHSQTADKQECGLLSCLRKRHLRKSYSHSTGASFVRRSKGAICPDIQKNWTTEQFLGRERHYSPFHKWGEQCHKRLRERPWDRAAPAPAFLLLPGAPLNCTSPAGGTSTPAAQHILHPLCWTLRQRKADPRWAREHNILQVSTPFAQILKAGSLHIYQWTGFKPDAKPFVNRASSGNNPASPLPLPPIA